MTPAFILLSILLCVICISQSKPVCKPEQPHYMKPGDEIQCDKTDLAIFCHREEEKSILSLWRTIKLHLNIKSDDFQLFEGSSPNVVRKEYSESSYFRSYWGSTKQRSISLPLFNETCIGVKTSQMYTVRLLDRWIDYFCVLNMLIGIVLFFGAGKLSRNAFFYYVTAVIFGVIGSLLLLFKYLSYFIPHKLPAVGFLVGGWSISLYVLSLLWDNVSVILQNYSAYVTGYVCTVGFISFCVAYYWGPPTNERSINILRWCLQIAGLLLIYISSDLKDACVTIIILVVLVWCVPATWIIKARMYWKRKFPPKHTFLTEEQYHHQGVVETNKGLNELREFCLSPGSEPWQLVHRLKNPKRFAEFMNGVSHLTDDEVLSYESEPYPVRHTDFYTDDENSDDD